MSAARKGSAVPSTSIEVAMRLATLEPCDLRRAPLAASVLEVPLRFGIEMNRHGLRTHVGHAIHASVSRETARPRSSSRARQTLRSEGLQGAMTCRHARPEAPVRHPSGCCRSGLGQAERLDRCEHVHVADRRTEASQAAMSKVDDATGKEGEVATYTHSVVFTDSGRAFIRW